MDELDAMRAFVAVADRGSFADAARQLRLSPAAVTRAVVQIEDRLGLLLLHRTTRSVRLTDRGAVYRDRCKQILNDLADADRLVRGEDARPRGLLAVAAPLMFGRLHVLPVLQEMLRAYPELTVRLTLSDRNVNMTEEGMDVAVRIGALADSALTVIKAGAVRRVLVASPDYLARRGTPRSPSELAGHDVILFEALDAAHDWRFGGDQVSLRVEPRLAVNSADAAISAASAGLGITRMLSYQVQEAVTAGRLVRILDAFGPPAIAVNIVSVSRRLRAPNVTAFIEAARTRLRSALGEADPSPEAT